MKDRLRHAAFSDATQTIDWIACSRTSIPCKCSSDTGVGDSSEAAQRMWEVTSFSFLGGYRVVPVSR